MVFIRRGTPMRLTSYGQHFLLYYWTFHVTDARDNDSITTVHDIMIADMHNVAVFGRDCIARWGNEYPEQLLKRMSSVLRDKGTTYEGAYPIYYILTALTHCNLQSFTKITMPEGTGLIPTLLIGWQRQRCDEPDKLTRKFYVALLIIM